MGPPFSLAAVRAESIKHCEHQWDQLASLVQSLPFFERLQTSAVAVSRTRPYSIMGMADSFYIQVELRIERLGLTKGCGRRNHNHFTFFGTNL